MPSRTIADRLALARRNHDGTAAALEGWTVRLLTTGRLVELLRRRLRRLARRVGALAEELATSRRRPRRAEQAAPPPAPQDHPSHP